MYLYVGITKKKSSFCEAKRGLSPRRQSRTYEVLRRACKIPRKTRIGLHMSLSMRLSGSKIYRKTHIGLYMALQVLCYMLSSTRQGGYAVQMLEHGNIFNHSCAATYR